MKIEIEIDDWTLEQITARHHRKDWVYGKGEPPALTEEQLKTFALSTIQKYPDHPERLTDQHKAAMILVRSWAVEQAVRSGSKDVTRDADGIVGRLLEDRRW